MLTFKVIEVKLRLEEVADRGMSKKVVGVQVTISGVGV